MTDIWLDKTNKIGYQNLPTYGWLDKETIKGPIQSGDHIYAVEIYYRNYDSNGVGEIESSLLLLTSNAIGLQDFVEAIIEYLASPGKPNKRINEDKTIVHDGHVVYIGDYIGVGRIVQNVSIELYHVI